MLGRKRAIGPGRVVQRDPNRARIGGCLTLRCDDRRMEDGQGAGEDCPREPVVAR